MIAQLNPTTQVRRNYEHTSYDDVKHEQTVKNSLSKLSNVTC